MNDRPNRPPSDKTGNPRFSDRKAARPGRPSDRHKGSSDRGPDKRPDKRLDKRLDKRSGKRPDKRPDAPSASPRSRNAGAAKPHNRGDPHNRDDNAPVTFDYPDEPKGIAVRRAAVDILDLVRDGASLDDALSQCRSYYALANLQSDTPDMVKSNRGFARAMATMVLRRRGTLDYLISPYLDRPLPAKAVRVMDILRVSAAQSLFLGTPHHASVSLATDLCKERKETAGYSKLVNAVARKLANTSKEKLDGLPTRLDTPAWLWRSWERAYGPAIARQIATAHLAPAQLDITVRDPSQSDKWADALGVKANRFNEQTASLRVIEAPPSITGLAGFSEGAWWVQDYSASLPVQLLGDLTGKTVIDLCAAPGGKTLQLAAAGAKVIAIDRAEGRMERVQQNLDRTNLKAILIIKDALDFDIRDPADIILLDAPCSATGTIRRHPDIPWSKSEDDIAAMVTLQQKLIDKALTMINPGGMVVYCTCSLQREEGEAQIKNALNRHETVQRLPFTAEDHPVLAGPLATAINRDGDIRLHPAMAADHGGMDGFFISRLIRKS